jgi:hypothetical protein
MTTTRRIVRTPAELEACWRHLIEPLGFSSRQIFALLFDRDGEMFPHIVHITECPRRPDAEMVGNLADALRHARDEADPEGSCALLWARPSGGGNRATDVEWARAFATALAEHGLARWPLHIADDTVMRVVAPDDLAA